MTKNEILTYLNTHPICYMATIDENKPHVRGMMIYRADEQGIIFHTGMTKDLHLQLKKNSAIELCFYDPKENFQIRVEGVALEDPNFDLKKEIVEKRDFLKPWVEKDGYEMLVVYRITNMKAHVWTLADNFVPKQLIPLAV